MIDLEEIEKLEFEIACAKIWDLKKQFEDPKIMKELTLFSETLLNIADVSAVKDIVKTLNFNISNREVSLSLPSIEVRFLHKTKEYRAEADVSENGGMSYSLYIKGEWSNLIDYKTKTLAEALSQILKVLNKANQEEGE